MAAVSSRTYPAIEPVVLAWPQHINTVKLAEMSANNPFVTALTPIIK
jgi:hypothetical protein